MLNLIHHYYIIPSLYIYDLYNDDFDEDKDAISINGD